jgi:N-acetylglucosamine-6-sulfatase
MYSRNLTSIKHAAREMNIMADMDQAGRLLSPGKIRAAFVLVAACLIAGCGSAVAERHTGETMSADETVGIERAANAGGLERPNIILILTDDLDAHPRSISHMPNLRRYLIRGGTTFENAFVTDSLCCPSRATILRGQYPHNHGILSNEPPHGGFAKFRSLGHENSTVATWLQSRDYRTVLFGKYMNGYETRYVPPGWGKWYAVSGNYTSTRLNENGHIVDYDPGQYHLDDVLAEKAANYVRDPTGNVPSFLLPNRSFFMWLGPTAPHQPAEPAPRHEDALPDVSLPRSPSFDEEDVSDKPDWVRDNPPLSSEQIAAAEDLYRKRLQSMLAVDEMIGQLVAALRESGELDNTYIFFTSDNGYHLGTHRLSVGKWTAYEEDIRVPLFVRGPGVPEGRKLEHLVLNNDLAPTFAQLGGAEPPSFVDGRSLVPLLRGDPPSPDEWRRAFLVEAFEELTGTPSLADEDTPRLLTGDQWPYEDSRRASLLDRPSLEDAGRPGLDAVRTEDRLYVEYETGESELYDLRNDPYELSNAYEDTELKRLWRVKGWLEALRDCVAEECRAAEDGDY